MSLLISILIWAAFAICLICAHMVNRNYDIMLDQVNRRLPEDQRVGRPLLSYKWGAIVRLHEQLYPESPTRREQGLLIRVFVISFGIMALIAIAWGMSRRLLNL